MEPANNKRKFSTFRDFYPYYLSEHADRTNRRLHFVGTSISLALIACALGSGEPLLLAAALLTGYTFAWIGHFGFEKNRTATFRHPVFSFLGDWVMWKDILIRRIPF